MTAMERLERYSDRVEELLRDARDLARMGEDTTAAARRAEATIYARLAHAWATTTTSTITEES